VIGRGRQHRLVALSTWVLVAALTAFLMPRVAAQLPSARDGRLAGLEWTFVRIRYTALPEAEPALSLNPWDESWGIDGPAAEQNLSQRLETVTSVLVHDPIVLRLTDERLWNYGWIYFVEPGTMKLLDEEVPILKEFLLRGGTATFDDFHGPYEWDTFEKTMKRVFPDRPIVELEPPHPIFSSFYSIKAYPQIAGLGSFFSGRSWEKGGFMPHLRAVLDDAKRPMVLINWNTDMGDGWEWSNAEEYPGYIKYTADAYRMMINEIVYSLTH
jgi:Domain of unknown function (DUF4159)